MELNMDLLIGVVLGAAGAFFCCAIWAYRAMGGDKRSKGK